MTTALARALAFTAILLVAADALADADVPPFQAMRSDENYAYLKDPSRQRSWSDPIKYISLWGDAYLSLGGEIRERVDVFDSPRFGIGSKSDTYELQRVLLHADLHFNDRVRLYTEISRYDMFNKRTTVLPVDRDPQDVQQLFLDVIPDPPSRGLIRIGRQELLLNPTQRFIGLREGPNIRQNYDGARVSWNAQPWKIDAFSLRPVLNKAHAFDDRGDSNTLFSGVYLSRAPGTLRTSVDLYWLALDHFGAKYGTTVGDERRRAVGARVARSVGPWDFEAEGMRQYGSFRNDTIRAWGGGLDGGYTWQARWRPRAGLRLDGASGGSLAKGRGVETFNPLFPKGLYYDETLLTTYANLLSIRPSVTVRPFETVSVQISEAWRWRQNVHDALYLIPFVEVPQTLNNTAKYVGQWSVVDAFWRPSRYWTLQAEYVHVIDGAAVRLAGGHSVDFGMFVAQFRF